MGLSLYACQAKKEGCIEPTARNFDAEATKNCCCDYFSYQLGIDHKWNGTADFELNKKYIDANNDTFKVNFFDFFLSDIILKDANNLSLGTNDKENLLTKNGSTISLTPSYGKVNISVRTILFGDRAQIGSSSRLSFKIGLNSILEDISYTDLASNHALKASRLYDTTQKEWIYQNLKIYYNDNRDSIELKIKTPISMDIPFAQTFTADEDLAPRIKIDYAILFGGISFKNDSPALIEQKIQQNWINAVSK